MPEAARQYDQLEKQHEHLKNNVKAQTDYMQTIDKRLVVLEQKTPEQLNHINWRLQSIDNTLNKITDKLERVCDYLNEYKGGLSAKNKMWVIFYSCLTIGGVYSLHVIIPKLILKLFGVNI